MTWAPMNHEVGANKSLDLRLMQRSWILMMPSQTTNYLLFRRDPKRRAFQNQLSTLSLWLNAPSFHICPLVNCRRQCDLNDPLLTPTLFFFKGKHIFKLVSFIWYHAYHIHIVIFNEHQCSPRRQQLTTPKRLVVSDERLSQ